MLENRFSDLRCHRFRHNFHCENASCQCQTGIEDNEHFLLHCPRFSSRRRHHFELVSRSGGADPLRLSSTGLTNPLLYGHPDLTTVTEVCSKKLRALNFKVVAVSRASNQFVSFKYRWKTDAEHFLKMQIVYRFTKNCRQKNSVKILGFFIIACRTVILTRLVEEVLFIVVLMSKWRYFVYPLGKAKIF